MRKRKLGAHGPEISVIGYGAWEAGGTAWGPNESEDVVIEAIRAGIDAGIDWIDTAEVYGDGVSELLVGRAIAGRRDEVVIASKVAPQPEGTGFAPAQVRAACEKSLGRLGIDRIDLYQLHWLDETGIPLEDTWGAMCELQDAGLIGAMGVSNFDREQIETCLAIRHVDSLQPEFSMLERKHAELIRWCGDQGIGVITYGPLAFGLLTGAITAETRSRRATGGARSRTTAPSRTSLGRSRWSNGSVRSRSGSDAPCPSSRSRGTSTSPASPPRSPGAGTPSTCVRTRPRATSSWTRRRSRSWTRSLA